MPDNHCISGEVPVAWDNDFSEPYLPDRYQQKIRKKQRGRLLKKILAIALALAIIAIVLIGIFGLSSTGTTDTQVPTPESTALVSPAVITASTLSQATPAIADTLTVTATPIRPYTIAPGVPVTVTGNSLDLEGAVAAFRSYYPESQYAIRSVNYSTGSTHSLFGFEVFPLENIQKKIPFVIFIDAATGTPYTPGAETAPITESQAERIAATAFPAHSLDTTKIWYTVSPAYGNVWQFSFSSGSLPLVSGRIDAETGEILSFSRHIPASDRKTSPSITQDVAQDHALRFITEKNGVTDLPLNLTSSRYDSWGTPSVPAAGEFVLSFERQYLDHPVDTDGITVAVDAETGTVIGYDRVWTTPDFAFSPSGDRTVMQRDAIFAVMEAAKNRFPTNVESIRIISSQLRWNNQHITGTSQRPGSVPLEWKVVFDDTTIRADPSLGVGIGWVDIQTGNVTSLNYVH